MSIASRYWELAALVICCFFFFLLVLYIWTGKCNRNGDQFKLYCAKRGDIWWWSYKCHLQGQWILAFCIFLLFLVFRLDIVKIFGVVCQGNFWLQWTNQEEFVFRRATSNWKSLLVTKAQLKLLQGCLLHLDSQTHQHLGKTRKMCISQIYQTCLEIEGQSSVRFPSLRVPLK